jgi:hypothetical protein
LLIDVQPLLIDVYPLLIDVQPLLIDVYPLLNDVQPVLNDVHPEPSRRERRTPMNLGTFLGMQGLLPYPNKFYSDEQVTPSQGGHRTMPDYVPSSDPELIQWLVNFVAVLTANETALGLTASDVTPLSTAKTALDSAISDFITKQSAYHSATQVKKNARGAVADILRPLVQRITHHPGMTDALRAQLGITVPQSATVYATAGIDVPALKLDIVPGAVVIHFGTDPTNEQHNGKPDWARGANIYRKKGAETDYQLIAFDTASPYVDHISGPAVNVSYQAAWRGTHEEDEGIRSVAQTVAAGG